MTDLELLEAILLGDKDKKKEKPEWVNQTGLSQGGGDNHKLMVSKPERKVKLNKYENVSRLFKEQVGIILDSEEGKMYGIKYSRTKKDREKERQEKNDEVLKEYNITKKPEVKKDDNKIVGLAKVIRFKK